MLDEKDIKKLTKILATKKDIDDRFDNFASMVQKGFEKTSTKEQVGHLELRIDKVEKGLATIRDLIIENHRKRIEKIETEIKELREMFAM